LGRSKNSFSNLKTSNNINSDTAFESNIKKL
jgi:hypothetical protein